MLRILPSWPFFLLLLGMACIRPQSDKEPVSSSGAPSSGLAQMVGPRVISSASPEFATSVSADGQTLFFNRSSPDRSTMQILMAEKMGESWHEPIPLAFSDGTYADVDPFLTPDGQRLYFSSNRPLSGEQPKDYDIWYVERVGERWSAPINLGAPVNTEADEVFCSVAAQGNMYFRVTSEDGTRAIFRALWEAGEYVDVERVVIPESDSLQVGNPAISPDEQILIVVGVDPEGAGGADLLITRRQPDESWGRLENAGPKVNSPYTEFAPYISPDGQWLYFSSERPGIVPEGAVEGRPPGDLYRIAWENIP